MIEGTIKQIVFSMITDFIWLSYGDIEKMFYVGGYRADNRTISMAITNLYQSGKLVRRGQRQNYQYMRVPS